MDEGTSTAIADFVAPYRQASGWDGEVGDAFAFGSGAEMADDLADLVVHAHKRATAGWLEPGDLAPEVGRHDIVLDGAGAPACLVRTEEVEVAPLRAVTPAFAWDEGEGDRTRRWWFDAHVRFFERQAAASGETFDVDRSPVHLQRFAVVWPEVARDDWLVEGGDLRVRPLRADERPWVATLLGDGLRSHAGEDHAGFAASDCPALVARRGLRSVGLLVFVPGPAGTEVVASVVLDGEPADVTDALHGGLEALRTRYGWGEVA